MNAGGAEEYTLQIQRGCQYHLRRKARKSFQSERLHSKASSWLILPP